MPRVMKIDEFNYISLIGKGTYAKVFLVSRKADN